MLTQHTLGAALLAYVASPHFLDHRTVTARFLWVLAFLYRQHPHDFEVVQEMPGYRRVYFALTAGEIQKLSKNTCAQQIPESPWWAQTNLNLQQKRAVLGRVLLALGYAENVAREVGEALDEGIKRPRN